MEAQTYSLFRALGGPDETLHLLLALLERPGKSGEIAARAGVSGATASRHLEAMALVGLVHRPSPRGRYALQCADEARAVIASLSALAQAILENRQHAEAGLLERLRRTSLRSAEDHGGAA